MPFKSIAVTVIVTLGLSDAAQAQVNMSSPSDDTFDNARPLPSRSHPSSASRKHATAHASRSDPHARPVAAEARDAVTDVLGGTAGLLNALFGARDTRPDSPGALTRE